MNNKMNKLLLKPLFTESDKDTFRSLKFRDKMRKNPLYSYALFSIILVLLNPLSTIGLVKTTFVSAIGSTLIYCILCLGFCLLLGYSALASLGTAGFYAIGANIAYYCIAKWELTISLTFVIAIGFALVVGIAVGYISLRIEGIYLAIVTLGIAQIIVEIFSALNVTSKLQGSQITLFGIETLRLKNEDIYLLMVAILFFLIVITHNLMNSPTGRAMLAMKNSTSAAQAFGISLLKYRLLAFTISIIYAVIAGVLFLLYERYVSHSSSTQFGLNTSLNVLAAVIIGGTKSIWGTIGATFIIFGIDKMFLQNIPFFRENSEFIGLFSGLLVILVVMFYPGGLAQLALEIKLKVAKIRTKIREAKYGKDLG